MYRLKIYVVFFILVSAFFSFQKVYASNIYLAGERIVGKKYNDMLKSWIDREFSIWVGVSEYSENIYFECETGLGDATVTVQNSKATKDKLKKAVEKAIEWSDIARKNQTDASKGLGCFGASDKYGLCKKGLASEENQMSLSFFAANGGKQTNLIIRMVDSGNQFIKADVYVDVPGMRKLLKSIDDIESAFEKARKTAKDQKLFE